MENVALKNAICFRKMDKRILISWIGFADLSAPNKSETLGIGPVARVPKACPLDEIVLLNNYPEKDVQNYITWITKGTKAKVIFPGWFPCSAWEPAWDTPASRNLSFDPLQSYFLESQSGTQSFRKQFPRRALERALRAILASIGTSNFLEQFNVY
ncbi:MAG: hypothetical protein K9N10_18550 [Deltaproteobacteria bacterium]|nr:hypothetical protein [Deltaproteobacteria bacterium]